MFPGRYVSEAGPCRWRRSLTPNSIGNCHCHCFHRRRMLSSWPEAYHGGIMRDLLHQIERGLQANLYYLSLIAALSVPDMCAALLSSDGKTTGDRYAVWFDQNVSPKYHGNLDGQTCYQFRCSLLHQGSTQHSASAYRRVWFLEPGTNSNIFHNNLISNPEGTALNIDVRIFCCDIAISAETWLIANEKSPAFQANFPKFIQRYPNGLLPYVAGTPVIG
jgi:hypothetical protein